MTRHNEHDAHKQLSRPRTFTDGYLQCKRELAEAAKAQLWLWIARCVFAFVAGIVFGVARGMS